MFDDLNLNEINSHSTSLVLSSFMETDPCFDPLFNFNNIDRKDLLFNIHNIFDCPICLMKAKNPCIIMSCKHIFCIKCLNIWRKISKKCPICRGKITKIKNL